MDSGELVGGPDTEDNHEDEAGEIDGTASAEAGVAADVDHSDVSKPHGEGQEDLGVAEVRCAVGDLREERAHQQAGCHAWKAEEQRLEGDGVDGGERWQLDTAGAEGLRLEAALLNQVENRGDERDEQGGVGGQE